MGPNYNRIVSRTGPLDCERSHGNIVQPEYLQSPHASTSAVLLYCPVLSCCYCVVREEIARISL